MSHVWQAKNTHQIFPWLWASGQLSAEDIAALPGAGIRNVINLALPSSNPALPGEAELVTAQGIAYYQIPVLWDAPQLSDLERFAGLLQLLNEEPTWVHCAMNMRVSSFIYLWRSLWRHEAEDTARQTLDAVWSPNPVWQTFITTAQATYAKP